jgi:phage terminase large subunit GpA-like protein
MIAFAAPPLDDRRQRVQLLEAVEAILRPPPRMSVAEWAAAKREMPKGSPMPGRYRHRNAPPLRQIMEWLSPEDPARKVVFMKSSGVGGSVVGENFVGHKMDCIPGSMLVVQPNETLVTRWVLDRFRPMIEATPSLRGKVGKRKFEAQTGDESGSRFRAANAVKMLQYDGGRGSVFLASGSSDAQVASLHTGYVYVSEVDKLPRNLRNQGSGLKQAEQRAIKYRRAKIYYESTPTNEGSSTIAEEHELGTQHECHVPCRYCGVLQPLVWEQVKWPRDAAGEHLPDQAYYECAACAAPWTDWDRRQSIRQCEWFAKYPERPYISCFLWSAYDLFLRLSDLAREWLACCSHPFNRRQFINQKLGRVYKASTREPAAAALLLARREPYGVTELPNGVAWINCGVDLGDDRAELEILGWGEGERTWSLDYRVIIGDPGASDFYTFLDELLALRFRSPGGVAMRIASICVNTAGHHAAQAAYNACKVRFDRKVFAVIGRSGDKPYTVSAPSTENVAKVPLFTAAVDSLKDLFFSWLALEPQRGPNGEIVGRPPGYCAFPLRENTILAGGGRRAYDAAWFDGLTAERRVKDDETNTSRYELRRPDLANEPLDCRVYALANREINGVTAQRLKEYAAEVRSREATTVQQPPPRQRRRVRALKTAG